MGQTEKTERLLTTFRWLNATAMAFSITHLLLDLIVFGAPLIQAPWLEAGIVSLVAVIYGWWASSMAAISRTMQPSVMSLLGLGIGLLFCLLNGATVVFCPPPCGGFVYADVSHIGNLIFGGAAAYATWRVIRVHHGGLGPGRQA